MVDFSSLKGATILVIDDDRELCEVIKLTFSLAGAAVTTASSGQQGLRLLFEQKHELVVLDVRMPEMDGWQVCAQIRLLSDVPIMMLTTLSDDQDQVRGFDLGVDEFLTKPFSDTVLLARANALLRRQAPVAARPTEGVYSDGNLSIDLARHDVRLSGKKVRLSGTEQKLLGFLLQNAGHICSYEQILSAVWGDAYRDSVDYVHVYVSHLRRKIESDSRAPRYLLTEHGIGYRFNPL